jgi:hypothetical protein
MTFSRVCAVVVAVSALAACTTQDASSGKEDVGSYESDLKLSSPRYLGPIANGQTITAYYYDPPRYRSFGFYARGGDQITVDISSYYGDAMGWITTSSYDVLAANDDASYATLDSKVTYTVPEGKPKRAYRIVFRDYDLLDATFSVSLSIQSASADDGDGDGDGDGETDGDGSTSGGTSSGGSSSGGTPACDPSSEPNRSYIGTPSTCPAIRFSCPAGQRSFSNACGCGCERY